MYIQKLELHLGSFTHKWETLDSLEIELKQYLNPSVPITSLPPSVSQDYQQL